MTSAHPLGEILHDGDTIGLRFERRLAHRPDRVWRALTESDQLRHWMPADIVGARREGVEVEVRFWPDVAEKYEIVDRTMPGRILTWDPPRTFSWQWDRDTLIFELHPDGDDATRLVFTTWVVDTTAGVDLTADGYHVCLDLLVALVDTDDPAPFVSHEPGGHVDDYRALLADS